MVYTQNLSSFGCELRIIRAKNIELKSNESLFVRSYLSAGKNTRVKLNTHEISSNFQLFWNQVFSLECCGDKNSLENTLSERSVIFELRRRVKVPFFGKICKSTLLGRAEFPWKSVFETKEMEIEKWLFMNAKNRNFLHEDEKPPAIQVGMKLIQVPAVKPHKRRRMEVERVGPCGSVHGGTTTSCVECDMYHMFVLAESLEAF